MRKTITALSFILSINTLYASAYTQPPYRDTPQFNVKVNAEVLEQGDKIELKSRPNSMVMPNRRSVENETAHLPFHSHRDFKAGDVHAVHVAFLEKNIKLAEITMEFKRDAVNPSTFYCVVTRNASFSNIELKWNSRGMSNCLDKMVTIVKE